jgi:hypothetical protein
MPNSFNLFEYNKQIDAHKILICYKGVITDTIISVISDDIRTRFEHEVELARKAFAIFVELAQNVFLHSIKKENGLEFETSMFMISEPEEGLSLSFGNMVGNEKAIELIKHCDIINQLNMKELRAFKREKRLESAAAHREGGGIGLIQTAIIAQNKLEVSCDKLDDKKSFFSVSVTIKKTTLVNE